MGPFQRKVSEIDVHSVLNSFFFSIFLLIRIRISNRMSSGMKFLNKSILSDGPPRSLSYLRKNKVTKCGRLIHIIYM